MPIAELISSTNFFSFFGGFCIIDLGLSGR